MSLACHWAMVCPSYAAQFHSDRIIGLSLQVDSTAAITSHHSPCIREKDKCSKEHVRLNIWQLTTELEVEVQHNHGQKQHVKIHMLVPV
jgi:hypothetical protein